MVPLLKDISLLACVQLAGRITDVGLTPYALIKPVLRRMNLKQLAMVEANSPTVTPESDEIWGLLIERDFPDRPIHTGAKQELLVGEQTDMPNKALYQRYMEERDTFRASSAQRLRKMTEKLRKEKSKNSITPIPSIIRNTPIRQRNYNSDPLPKFSSKSILGKAMKDIQLRKLMFGGQRKPAYDPYAVFKRKQASPPPQAPRLRLLHQKEPERSVRDPNAVGEALLPPRPPSQASTMSLPRKRPAPAGIFVPKKKMPPRAPRIPPETEKKPKPPPPPPSSQSPSKQKVRLSIFH